MTRIKFFFLYSAFWITFYIVIKGLIYFIGHDFSFHSFTNFIPDLLSQDSFINAMMAFIISNFIAVLLFSNGQAIIIIGGLFIYFVLYTVLAYFI